MYGIGILDGNVLEREVLMIWLNRVEDPKADHAGTVQMQVLESCFVGQEGKGPYIRIT